MGTADMTPPQERTDDVHLSRTTPRYAQRKILHKEYVDFLAAALCIGTSSRYEGTLAARIRTPPNDFTMRSRCIYENLEECFSFFLHQRAKEPSSAIVEPGYGSSCIAHDFVVRTVAQPAGSKYEDEMRKIKLLDASNLFGNEAALAVIERMAKKNPHTLCSLAAATFSGNNINTWEPGIWSQSGGEIIAYSIESVQKAFYNPAVQK